MLISPRTIQPHPDLDRSIQGLESDAARHTAIRDQAQLGLDDASRRAGEAERRMAELSRDIQAIAARDKTFNRWMSVTNWVGRAFAAGAVVGMATFSASPLVGAGLFLGGLAGFAGAYLFQMKARVRHAVIMSEAVPMARQRDSWEQVRTQASAEASAFQGRVDAAEKSRREIQSRLDVMRMARGKTEGGTVEVEERTIRVGGIAVPRKAQPSSITGE